MSTFRLGTFLSPPDIYCVQPLLFFDGRRWKKLLVLKYGTLRAHLMVNYIHNVSKDYAKNQNEKWSCETILIKLSKYFWNDFINFVTLLLKSETLSHMSKLTCKIEIAQQWTSRFSNGTGRADLFVRFFETPNSKRGASSKRLFVWATSSKNMCCKIAKLKTDLGVADFCCMNVHRPDGLVEKFLHIFQPNFLGQSKFNKALVQLFKNCFPRLKPQTMKKILSNSKTCVTFLRPARLNQKFIIKWTGMKSQSRYILGKASLTFSKNSAYFDLKSLLEGISIARFIFIYKNHEQLWRILAKSISLFNGIFHENYLFPRRAFSVSWKSKLWGKHF